MAKEVKVDLSTSVSLQEATDLIQHTGRDVSYVVRGEMGIGKTTMLAELAARLPTHKPYYMDMTLCDVGDTQGVPIIETINGVKVTRFAPNYMLGFQNPEQPIILMLDEIGKASPPVLNTSLRIILEKALGEYRMHPDSIVFGTLNLVTEGVGDRFPPHAFNRCSVMWVRKPSAKEWVVWALSNNVEAEVIAWVQENEHCLASFTDGMDQKDNPYIFMPGTMRTAFVSPRSLYKGSLILAQRAKLGDNALRAGLAGCVGESAARDLLAYTATSDSYDTWERIIANPTTAKVPEPGKSSALFMLVYRAVVKCNEKTLTPWLQYCERLPKEYQAVFALQAAATKRRLMFMENRTYTKWAVTNSWLV